MSDKPKTVIAMSGGVDSSVAAWLLKEQGHDVAGFFMWKRTFSKKCEAAAACCSQADADDAARVAEAIGIPFHVVNFEREFAALIDFFCREYSAGRTPNPCILCNDWLKFGKLFDYADRIGAGHVATGHYARVEHRGGRHLLLRGLDANKDQSYVLFSLGQQQLARAIFPDGALTKPEIRRLAASLNLPVKDKPESQEICFVPDDDYGAFIRDRTPDAVKPGPVLDLDGAVLGEHPGIQFFTIGQRHGLRIAFGKPMYVVRLDAARNAVIVGPDSALLRRELVVSPVNWIIVPPASPIRADVKIRYKQPAQPASVEPLPDGRARVVFDSPVRAVAPGQAGVFYVGEVVAGGGWIE